MQMAPSLALSVLYRRCAPLTDLIHHFSAPQCSSSTDGLYAFDLESPMTNETASESLSLPVVRANIEML